MDTPDIFGNLIGSIGQLPPWVFAAGAALVAVEVARVAFRGRLFERWTARPVLNKSEQRLYKVLADALAGLPEPRPRLLCQVSYGEFLASRSSRAFYKINAKRADFLIVSSDFAPLIAVEYQGKGHYGASSRARRDAERRDGVKRRALASAGIVLMEVPATYDARSIRETIRATLLPDDQPGVLPQGGVE